MSRTTVLAGFALTLAAGAADAAGAQGDGSFLRDRRAGIRTSIFATYVRSGELLVHPFFEAYRDKDKAYTPSEFGFAGSTEFTGKYRASEGLLFIAYGINDRVALEIEAAAIDATLEKSPSDGSAMPSKVQESGPGDMQVQFDFRLLHETEKRPEVFAFFETVFPSNTSKPLIGTPDFEYKAGGGLIRGTSVGTFTTRAAIQYVDGAVEAGEWAVEYLRRFSPRWRMYAGVEGTQGEVELIGELQWQPRPRIFFRFNCGYGLTASATDLAPDVGIVFSRLLR